MSGHRITRAPTNTPTDEELLTPTSDVVSGVEIERVNVRSTRGRFLQDLKRDWQEIGRLDRVALVGVLGSAIVAVALGFSITASARGHLLDARTDLLETVARDLAELGAAPPVPDSAPYARFDEEVRLRLLGGETVRVKLWTSEGTIAYSDEPALEGRTFELPEAARAALAGESSARISDPP